MDQFDVALLVVRVWTGLVILAHGLNHARSLDGTARWFEAKGFRHARLIAMASAYFEVAIAAGLIFGLLTPFAAAGLAATMVVAFWAIHRFAGFFVFHRPDEGYEYVATLVVVAFALAIVGPGEMSVDAVIGVADDLSSWVGAAVFGGGLVAAASMLAVFWRNPDNSGKLR